MIIKIILFFFLFVAEDPLYVLENDIPVDYSYYIENQIRKPLERIFEPIMGDPSSLFNGEHTRKVSLTTAKKGGKKNGVVVPEK